MTDAISITGAVQDLKASEVEDRIFGAVLWHFDLREAIENLPTMT